MNTGISLNGIWTMDYLSNEPYTDSTEPQIRANSDSAAEAPVPGYWEDMDALFRSTALHTKIRVNPLYTLQKYPQAGYVPDMALPNPVGCFVYCRTFVISELVDCSEIQLAIGGAQNTVSAWINGHYLGRHEGYSAPFSFSVPRRPNCFCAGRQSILNCISQFYTPCYSIWPIPLVNEIKSKSFPRA